MLKISIPTPCHEDWNKMTPDETGRHCSSCAKSVVDFTGMSDEEVKYFFLNKKEERVCGRFKQTQLHRIVIELPQNIFSIRMPLWKKFLAACLVVFSTTLFSCETKINNKVMTNTEICSVNDINGLIEMPPDSIEKSEFINDKTINKLADSSSGFTGGIVCVKTDRIPFLCVLSDSSVNKLKGDIEIIESDSAKLKQTYTIPVPLEIKESIFMGDSIFVELPVKKLKPDSLTKTKNPPKADSINCNSIKNYY